MGDETAAKDVDVPGVPFGEQRCVEAARDLVNLDDDDRVARLLHRVTRRKRAAAGRAW
ncbi:MAG TPA: hypothetical protein VGV57_12345 [Thermoleophilaceae bacterium]|nr:hypothetical protein [Thermoleophilaceae bacterium]